MFLAHQIMTRGFFNDKKSSEENIDSLFRPSEGAALSMPLGQCVLLGLLIKDSKLSTGEAFSEILTLQVNAPSGTFEVDWNYGESGSTTETFSVPSAGDTTSTQYLNRPYELKKSLTVTKEGSGKHYSRIVAIRGINYIGSRLSGNKLTESFVGGSPEFETNTQDGTSYIYIASIVDYSKTDFTLGSLTPEKGLRRVMIPNLVRVEKYGLCFLLKNPYLTPLALENNSLAGGCLRFGDRVAPGHPFVCDFTGGDPSKFMSKNPPEAAYSCFSNTSDDSTLFENVYIRVPVSKENLETKFPINKNSTSTNLRVMCTDGNVDYNYNAKSPYDGTEDVGSATA